MPEDAPAVEETTQEAPESGSQTETPAPASQEAPAVDYEKRYEDLRSQYDRIHPRFNEYEQVIAALQNPETQADVLRAFGIELEEEDPTDPSELDEPLTKAEWMAWQEAQQAQQQAAQQSAQMLDSDTEFATQTLDELGIKDDDPILDTLIPLALANRDEQGRLGIKSAYEQLKSFSERDREAYLKSKRAEGIPNGQAGTEKVDLGNDDARAQLLANMLEAGQQD